MRKHSTYTTLKLELYTSASTVAIMHVCQLLHQEFDVHIAYVYIYFRKHMATIETMSKGGEQIKDYSCIVPLQLGMAIC